MKEKLTVAVAAIAALLGLSAVALGWQGSLLLISEDGLNLQNVAFVGVPTAIVTIYFFSVRRWISQQRYGLTYIAALAITVLSISAYIYLQSLAI